MNKITTIVSFISLIPVSIFFGAMKMPTEMGLAITAGFLGLVFSNIDRLVKFKGGGFEAEFRDQIEAVIEKETEIVEPIGGDQLEAYGLVGGAHNVVAALKNPKFTWRYPAGIIQESGESEQEVANTLECLLKNKLARTSTGNKGTIWSLTPKGREVFKNTERINA